MHTRMVARLFAVIPLLALMSMLLLTSTVALAFTQSNFISFTLEGCRNDGTIILPINGQFICPDAAYTTGNLGKGWNELDLVPHRLTTSAGNQGGVTTDYSVYVAADYQTSGHLGYDVISVPTVNAAKSDASCTVSAGSQSTQGSVANPFGGGTDVAIYRELTIHQNPGTTCVFDYYQRLALGAHLYPGSSLQSYMFDQTGLSGSKKTISIPVNQILPQSISKNMTATQGTDSIWDITKQPSPAKLSFGNTCDTTQSLTNTVQITVSWTKLAATPSGPITVITHVYATNPASRIITTNVTDVIYSGTTQLDSATSGPIDVPANTANFPILTHTFNAPSGTTNLNDIATATYTDKITGIPVPGTTTATASATVQLTGPALDQSAVINDVESITGAGLSYSAGSFTPAIGAFDGGYVAGTKTTGSVSWTSNSQTGSGSVTFNKTVYVDAATSTSGTLSDTAKLTGSSGFTASTSAAVSISADARVSLTINKTVAPALTSGSQTFTFHVLNSSNVEVAKPTITFNAGDTSKSVTVGNLAPGSYTVSEDPVNSWITDSTKSVTINLPSCSGSVSFSNTHVFSPAISTTPNPTSATVGAILNDSATLTGGYNPTGNIVFNLYGPNDATCAGPALYNQTVAVSGSSASTSPGFTTTSPGTYRWTASYSGDTYNKPVASGCQDEQVTVNKATPTLTTSASGPVTVGQAINDVATLGGGYNPTGSITFDVFAPGDTTCATATNVPPAMMVTGAGNYTSGSYTTTAVGTYRWIAHYSGDANNNAVNTTCNDANESSTVNKASPSIATQATPTTGTVGVALKVGDAATLSNGYNPSGSVTFTLYSDNTCKTATTVSGSGTISNGSASFSTSWTPAAVGTYYWIASYAGDGNNNGFTTGCGDANEQIVIGPASPSIATQATPTTGTVGVALTVGDAATLSNGYNPSGSVTFTLYSDNACTKAVGVSGSGTISSGSASFSTSWTPTATGTYYWIASYAGDTNNNGFTTTCGDANEKIVIGPASPSITTLASPTTGTVGVALTVGDKATLTGGYNPSGSVTFTLYSDNKCTVAAGVSGSVAINNGSANFSTSWTPTATGTYYWIASYAGDTNNNGFTTTCGDANEKIVIGPASPSITTKASPTSGTVGVALTNVGDTATLTGGYNPSGSVTFTLYSDNKCTVAAGVSGSGAISNGSASYAAPSWTPTAAGTYYWKAVYAGDTNNNGFTTGCGDANEQITINKVSPSIVTTATNATGASTTITDTVTLSGGYKPTGSITFKLYGPSATPACTNLVFTSSPVAVNGNGTYGPVSFSPAAVGTYYWIASYTGDGNNNPVSGACGDTNETSVVSPGHAKVVKTVGGVAPTGTQVFTFQLRQGASTTSDGTVLEQVDANSTNNWTINFATLLVPGQHYQVCEWVYPGWNTSLGPNLFVPSSIIPPNLPNPNVNNLTVCTDFVPQAGQTTTFTVDNTPPPGGRALTIGFWKNWASCNSSNGKQKPILDQTLAVATGMPGNTSGGLVVSALNPGGGWPSFAATYYLVLKGSTSNPNVAPDCLAAVNLLNKTTIDGKTKMASDPLFNMAAQLVGAQLNYFAGAGKNGSTTLNIQSAVLLLGKYQFNGLTYSPKLTTADASRANCLATQLDNYNNDRVVSTCP